MAHFCGECGAPVAPGATSCPRCRVFFSGVGQGTPAEQAERQRLYKQQSAAAHKHQREQARQRRKGQRVCGSQRKWLHAKNRNGEALRVLDALCATVQQRAHQLSMSNEPHVIDAIAHEVVWLRTSPPNRDPRMNPFSPWSIKEVLVGPRLKYPTKRALRHVENEIVRIDKRPGEPHTLDVDYNASRLKDELDRLLQ